MKIIADLRKQKKITQAKLAQIIGIGRSTLAMYETDGSEPDLATISKLADFFGVSVDYLLGREEKKPSENQEDKNRLYVPEQYRDVMVAFQDGAENLTQEDIDAVVNFIEYMKSKKK